MKHLFYDDYSEGMHPALLEAIAASNDVQARGYGTDQFCEAAADRIREVFAVPGAAVHFLPTGTVANVIGLTAPLRSYEGIIATATAHISTHETGAIEATGHKVITTPSEHGKLTPQAIRDAMATFEDEHTVLPRVVEIAQATELGTVYSLEELRAIVAEARMHDLFTFADGARLSMALATGAMSAAEYGAIGFDMFWIGGVKVGGMLGEALVVNNDELNHRLRFHIKQRGALAAKGRFFGVQFERFFRDGLWFELGRLSNEKTAHLAAGLQTLGVQQAYPLETNQLFIVLPTTVMEALQQTYGFYRWEAHSPGYDVVRLVCSWATPDSAIDAFLDDATTLLR